MRLLKKKKIIIITFIIFILLICALISAYLIDKKSTFDKQKKYIPGIVCIGDSLTEGTAGSYPSNLAYILREANIRIPVVNLGIGGENTVTIAGRMGAIPYRVEALEIPEGTEKTEIRFINEPGKNIEPLKRSSDGGINPCYICGVEGTISLEYKDDQLVYYFTRSEAGEKIQVPSGSEIETYASTAYNEYIYIVFMGENVSYENAEELLEQQKAILETQTGDDRFIIIGLTSGSREERAYLENLMEEYWGERYINLREIFTDKDILESYGVSLSEDDLRCMEDGIVPMAILSDGIHYTETGYIILANVVYEKMMELGYLDEVNELADAYTYRWGWIQKIKDLL